AAAEKWAALPVGTELSYEWTPRQSPARTRAAAQQALVTVPARPRRESGKAGDRHGRRRLGPDGC
ncbi:MAG TPA: hypothetical protein VG123_22510, partial [Streptosporangiaceae bacterium]|nr:hypothetical protein [Streptosporangiaceae bacterium]